MTIFERWWLIPVEGVLLMFGLVNAGVPCTASRKGCGRSRSPRSDGRSRIVAAAGVAVAAGLHLPLRVGWRELAVVGCTAAVGLVFALFFATAVMPLGTLLLEMKMGALITIAGGGLAFAVARLLRVGRFAR